MNRTGGARASLGFFLSAGTKSCEVFSKLPSRINWAGLVINRGRVLFFKNRFFIYKFTR